MNHNNNPGKGKTYWLYGKHAVDAALKNPRRKINKILATKNAIDEMQLKSAVSAMPTEIEKHLPAGAVHQGVAAEVFPLPQLDVSDMKNAELLLILDQVTDPHNVGAILRSCAAFGGDAIIVQDKNAPQESGALAKAASGALETVPMIHVTNLSMAMEELKGYGFWCAGMDGEAKDHISKIHGYDRLVIVLGAEGKGIRRLVKENCDLLVKVPINDTIESLNVSNAAAVALYELSR